MTGASIRAPRWRFSRLPDQGSRWCFLERFSSASSASRVRPSRAQDPNERPTTRSSLRIRPDCVLRRGGLGDRLRHVAHGQPLLHRGRRGEGEAWARYLAANVTDLARNRRRRPAVAGEPGASSSRPRRSATSSSTRSSTPMAGCGSPPIKLEEVGQSADAIPVHNPEAAEAVLEGETEVEVKEGTSPNRPAFYAEAYVPVVADGEIIGIVEVYVDQSAKRDNVPRGRSPARRSCSAASSRPPSACRPRLLLAHAAEAGSRYARRVPRRSRPADGPPEPHALHAGPRPGRIAGLPGRGPHASTSTASRR